MIAWLAGLWTSLLFVCVVGNGYAEAMPGATLGNLTGPVDTIFMMDRHLYDVVWGNELFVAVGQSGFDETEVLLSPDGVAWERVSLGKPARPLGVSGDGVGALYGIAWNGSVFVAVGERLLTSTDGKSWTVSAPVSSCVFSRVKAHGATFVAVGGDRGRGCIASSIDGKKWTDRTAALASNNAVLTSVFSTETGFLAIGNANLGRFGLSSVVLSSSDGRSWRHESGPQEFLIDVAGNGSLFVTVGGLAHKGAIFTSSDGRNWAEQPIKFRKSLHAVMWNGVLFVAIGAEGALMTSADGMTWKEQSSPALQDLFGLAWSGSRFVAVGEGAILTSLDGAHWQEPGGEERMQ